MPQTKRRRRTKHRGNAAGVVESRGRTGRKPTAAEKNASQRDPKQSKARQREARLDKPPTWKSAFYKSLALAALMVLVLGLMTKKPGQTIIAFPVVMLIYVPLSYYTDVWVYKRRQRQKARQAQRAR